ncbi:MAG: hypothetical protein A2Z40_03345 [Deltaproteobacteria bacterium RBG_19FT_COMBO_60_16]|nr:MAG: hypothetical protein A2Z40_03345 [Deltaproteobacteria bacterium RBG_19FT_COMBO_60_16]
MKRGRRSKLIEGLLGRFFLIRHFSRRRNWRRYLRWEGVGNGCCLGRGDDGLHFRKGCSRLRIQDRDALSALATTDPYPFRSLEQGLVQAESGVAGWAFDDHGITLADFRDRTWPARPRKAST